MSFERVLFRNLIHNEEFASKVFPFIKPEYFTDPSEKRVFDEISAYVGLYHRFPTVEAMAIDLSNAKINQNVYEGCIDILKDMTDNEATDVDWLVAKTEKFCQDAALFNAITTSLEAWEDKTGKVQRGAIPQILTEALAVSFETKIGHDYIEDSEKRIEYYNRKLARIPFDLDYLNKATKGGLLRKTLSILLAGTHVGKTLAMCHMAAGHLMAGYNVLYITLEISEEEIGKRIDANLLDVDIGDLETIHPDVLRKKMQRSNERVKGKLVVHEYPPTSSSVLNIRHLLNELRIKKNFKPDIIYVDYINIMASARVKKGNVNSYEYVKCVAEELRGLAVEENVAVMSATQTTRSGFKSSDLDLDDTSESWGLPQTADFFAAMMTDENLMAMGQLVFKILKNRLGGMSKIKRFIVGVDYDKQRLYNCEDSAQEDLLDGPLPTSVRTFKPSEKPKGGFK